MLLTIDPVETIMLATIALATVIMYRAWRTPLYPPKR
jgi:hypothetical protein